MPWLRRETSIIDAVAQREARDAARDEYNAFYRVLMKRCQSRIRYAAIKDREARE